jgi:Tfp pilus assembly protein PilW
MISKIFSATCSCFCFLEAQFKAIYKVVVSSNDGNLSDSQRSALIVLQKLNSLFASVAERYGKVLASPQHMSETSETGGEQCNEEDVGDIVASSSVCDSATNDCRSVSATPGKALSMTPLTVSRVQSVKKKRLSHSDDNIAKTNTKKRLSYATEAAFEVEEVKDDIDDIFGSII